jgi:hypothetical protein
MKTQTGMRLDVQAWENFKDLCRALNVRPNEAVEAFLKVCIERQNVASVLNTLQAENPAEKLAHELEIKEAMCDLEIAYNKDRRRNALDESFRAHNAIGGVIGFLPKITDPQLLEKARSLVEEALAYYKEKEQTEKSDSES